MLGFVISGMKNSALKKTENERYRVFIHKVGVILTLKTPSTACWNKECIIGKKLL